MPFYALCKWPTERDVTVGAERVVGSLDVQGEDCPELEAAVLDLFDVGVSDEGDSDDDVLDATTGRFLTSTGARTLSSLPTVPELASVAHLSSRPPCSPTGTPSPPLGRCIGLTKSTSALSHSLMPKTAGLSTTPAVPGVLPIPGAGQSSLQRLTSMTPSSHPAVRLWYSKPPTLGPPVVESTDEAIVPPS